jgi:solute carrier family 36 (proton-coupled amino acid transporter)
MDAPLTCSTPPPSPRVPVRAWWSYAIIALYCLALVFTFPLQLFPVLRIVERGLTGFGISSASDKHLPLKRCVRAGVVALVLLISYVGSGQLNNLVSLVGCFTCTPLAFIFPCMFHLKLVPQTSLWVRVSNWAIVALGLAVFGFSTYESIATWGETVVQPCLLTPGDS